MTKIAKRCPVCNGYCEVGFYPDRVECHGCDGKGYIEVPKNKNAIKCPACDGHGSKKKDTCKACKGKGYLIVESDVEA